MCFSIFKNSRKGQRVLLEQLAQLVLGLGLVFTLGGCSSSGSKLPEEKVLSRSDNLSSRPEWVTETKTTNEKGDVIEFIGVAEVPGSSRPQASFMASDAAARGFLVNKIETKVTKIVESANTGFSMENQSLKSLIHEWSQVNLKDVQIKDRYWEKVGTIQSTGEMQVVLKAFSLISVTNESLKKIILDNTKKGDVPGLDENTLRSALETNWNSVGY